MKTALIGVYETQDKAVAALQKLQKSEFPVKQLSIVGKAYLGHSHVHVKANDKMEQAEVSIGAVAGGVIGILANFGIFAVPGLGLLYGAGALLSFLAGAEGGFIVGGIAAIFTTAIGVDDVIASKYEKELARDRFIVIAQGNKKQIALAHEVLHTQGLFLELDLNDRL